MKTRRIGDRDSRETSKKKAIKVMREKETRKKTRDADSVRLLFTSLLHGGLAQLARAPALHAGGQRFESVILHPKRVH